ncbi:hypothetical protein SB780_37045, partial [Burkholderia sp. SIMBA_057]
MSALTKAVLAGSLLIASTMAAAGVVQVRGTVAVPYSTGIFSSAPDASSNKAAFEAAKLAA